MNKSLFEYRLRDCAPALLKKNCQSSVKRKYDNGFDAQLADAIIYFTPNIARMNPFSVLIPESFVYKINEGDKVKISQNSIAFNNNQLERGSDIVAPEFRSKIGLKFLEDNLQLLGRNLVLFGRGSYAKAVDISKQKFACDVADLFDFEKPDNFNWNEIKQKLGHGEGLTPSFDDFLSGVIFADRILRFDSLVVPADFVQGINIKTTIQSCQQLKCALKGKMNLGFEKFMILLPVKKMKSAEISVILNYGHTSGADILSGVWFYLTNKVRILRNI